jgi:hypothetical protein
MKTKLLLSLLLFCFCLGCKKEEVLPKATQNGANTIGCKINGKNCVADEGGCFSCKKYSLLYTHGKHFVLSANQIKDEDNSTVQIGLEKLTSTGAYNLNVLTDSYPRSTNIKNFGSFERNKPSPFKEFITNPAFGGTVDITRVDTINRIVAGTFEFTAENLDGSGETIKVTDGRFDIKY